MENFSGKDTDFALKHVEELRIVPFECGDPGCISYVSTPGWF